MLRKITCVENKGCALGVICTTIGITWLVVITKLVKTVVGNLDSTVLIKNNYFWTDSKICVAWIRTTHREWVSWMQHRVNTVRSLSLFQNWYWVGSKDNSADIPTRKNLCEELIKNELWWNGPPFLKEKQPSAWRDQIEVNNDSVDPAIAHELKKNPKVFTYLNSERRGDELTCQDRIDLHKNIDINKYSILKKLLIIIANILRFIRNFRYPEKKGGVLSLHEINRSKYLWIKSEQNNIISNSKFKNIKMSLRVFSDKDAVLWVNGRFGNYTESFERNYPILLREDSQFTELIILDAHRKVKHAGE